MGKRHVVSSGECITSIAFENGFHPRTLWNHPNNTELRRIREAGSVLMAGDTVYVPDLQIKEVERPTDAAHKFVKRGVPEILNIRFLNPDSQPRSNRRYQIIIDGTIKEGVTDSEGFVKAEIPPNARIGHLKIYEEDYEEEYELQLGHLLPIAETKGIQTRLSQLGYFCKNEKGELDDLTRTKISEFQKDYGLEPSGEPDEQTCSLLQSVYGS
jgi:hypothetical protein